MIRIQHGYYRFEDFSLVIEIDVPRGSTMAVIGPSGAGKSTLLSIIAGFETLRAGSIQLDGKEVAALPPAERPVSMIFQDHNAFPHLTAFENVALGIAPSMKLSSAQNDSIMAALQHVGLANLAQRRPGEMSGGERQRIALARVLVRDKPILLLDEPFTALGPALRKEMLALVKTLQSEKSLTVMMVTHDPQDAKAIADHVIYVDNGMTLPSVPVQEFFASDDPAIRAYLG